VWGILNQKYSCWQTFIHSSEIRCLLMLDEMTPGQNALIFAIFLEIQNIQLQ
jgi:hypothetical protein